MSYWTALERLVEESEIVIDRPRGRHHPRFPEVVYPFDYGYLVGTSGGDGHGIDVWVGSRRSGVTGVVLTVDLQKRDVEQKILLGCDHEEMERIERFHDANRQSPLLLVRPD